MIEKQDLFEARTNGYHTYRIPGITVTKNNVVPEFREGLYWELVVSPSGSVFDALHAKRFQHWGGDRRPGERLSGLKTGCAMRGKENGREGKDAGYRVEVAVPFREIPSYTRGNPPQVGDVLRLMLVRLDKNGEGFKVYAFQPLLSWGHNIWNYARLELVK
jgi:hypothetical protein